ncbi:hypothetical protein DYQ95_01560 [Xanthomonas sp. LMG 9002]|nr:hypothetical protein [Xanthomonas sp. LMG 9002]
MRSVDHAVAHRTRGAAATATWEGTWPTARKRSVARYIPWKIDDAMAGADHRRGSPAGQVAAMAKEGGEAFAIAARGTQLA